MAVVEENRVEKEVVLSDKGFHLMQQGFVK